MTQEAAHFLCLNTCSYSTTESTPDEESENLGFSLGSIT